MAPSPKDSPARVLVVEPDPDLRDLVEMILSGDGYRVEIPPTDADAVALAARTMPDVVILGIAHPKDPRSWQILDQIQANPRTRMIPVVVISTSEAAAAEAQAAPVVGSPGSAVVSPYNIGALEEAVTHALKNPPPAAALPRTSRQPSPAVVFATDSLGANARQLAVQTVQQLRGIEPYASQFSQLTTGLVDDIGTMLGAIVDGMRRGLPPREVFRIPTIRKSVQRHVRLRESQGLGAAASMRECLAIRDQIDRFLQGLIGQHGFTAHDASEVSGRAHAYVGELMRLIGEDYAAGPR